MRIGIYGGSFNPIHVGHTSLAEWLVAKGYVDELWFLVSPQNPLKENKDLLADDVRLSLAMLAVESLEKQHGVTALKVSDFEFHLPRPSYMVNTLQALREQYPMHDFILIIGADNWCSFDAWYQPRNIISHHQIIIFPRKGFDIKEDTLLQGVTYVNSPLYELSATSIRQQIACNSLYCGEGLHPAVWQEIKEKGYYQ